MFWMRDETLKMRNAVWHKSCSLKFLPPKIGALLHTVSTSLIMETDNVSTDTGTLRDLDAPFTSVERRETRSRAPKFDVKEDICFLCRNPISE